MLFDWKNILLFIGASQGLILGLIILFNKQTNNHKRVFGLLMICFAFTLAEYSVFISHGGFKDAIHLFGYRYPIRFCIGPLFYIYTLGLTQKRKLGSWQLFLNFIPSIISLLLLTSLLTRSRYEKSIIFNNFTIINEPYYYTLIAIIANTSILSIIVYVGLSLKKMISYRKITLEYHSNESEIWVASFYRFSAIYFVVLIGYLIAVILRIFKFEFYDLTSTLFLIMSFSLMISLIILTVTVLYQNPIIPIELAHIVNDSNQLTQKPIIIEEEELDIINNTMIEKELFLDCNLTINDLAKELKTPTYILSKKINNGFDKTFFRYVNEFRINHAKNLLIKTDIKILAVALDSGFSNKASFHRTFKRIVGTTPYDYRLKSISKSQ